MVNFETPEADAVEQFQHAEPGLADDEPLDAAPAEAPLDANPADLVEQQQVVPDDDSYDR